MAETKKRSRPESIGRILDYTQADEEEKIVSFKKRVEEQIAVIKIGIANGDVNDVKKAESYARKSKEFLAIPFFEDKKNKDKRVHHLKTYCKVTVGADKDIIDVLKKWIEQKRSYKISTANRYFPANKKDVFEFYPEIRVFYTTDITFLENEKVKYKSELILVNKIKGLMADKTFMEGLGAKGSWKVETFKEMLQEWSQDYPFGVEGELDEIFALPYFRYKKYLTLELREFKEFIDVRSKSLDYIIGWFDDQILSSEVDLRDIGSQHEAMEKATAMDLLWFFDKSLEDLNNGLRGFEQEYKLYRFGQGMIEADIFDTLYK